MNKEIRRKDRKITDIDQILATVNKAKILHLGLIEQEFPYIVPLHYGYEYNCSNDSFVFYMHGAKIGHKLELIKNDPHACIELETDVEPDPAADSPCKYGSFYSSFIGQGTASIVEDPEEKERALHLLMVNQTGRRFEFTENMLAAVAVIKVEITDYTVKARVRQF